MARGRISDRTVDRLLAKEEGTEKEKKNTLFDIIGCANAIMVFVCIAVLIVCLIIGIWTGFEAKVVGKIALTSGVVGGISGFIALIWSEIPS